MLLGGTKCYSQGSKCYSEEPDVTRRGLNVDRCLHTLAGQGVEDHSLFGVYTTVDIGSSSQII